MATTLNARAVDPRDLELVAGLASELSPGSPLTVVLQHLVSSLGAGEDVAFLQDGEHLTPNQAADLLHMSRPHLLKFMDGGDLAFYRVGNRRRIRMTDLLDFISRRERAQATIANAFGNPALVKQALRDSAARLSDQDLAELNGL